MSLSQQVLVNFEYRYKTRDGSTVSIKPNEYYDLVAKTNENWWHVRRDETAKPFFIPAMYVTELPSKNSPTQLDPPEEFSGCDSPDGSAQVTLRDTISIKRDTEKDGHRISTYIIPNDFFQPKVSEQISGSLETEDLQPELHIYDTVEGVAHENNHSPPVNGETSENIFLAPVDTVTDPQRLTGKDSSVYDNKVTMTKPESAHAENNPEIGNLSRTATVQTSNPPDQSTVEDDNALTAVYVNLPRLRRSSINTSVPPASPLQDFPDPPDTLLPDSLGWEVHTDDQSGQEYYYQPSTGQTTWEYPQSLSMESSVRAERTPSPHSFPQSPGCSPMGSSPRRWSSDWEKVLDENTGKHYFYNPVSGQSSWDPPEHFGSSGDMSFLKDCPPPLPEEDYPASPEPEERTRPLTEEYSLINVRKVSIPRVNLDRSSPPGWTLNIDPDGVWLFTSDYTQEQWIKSIDDVGRTYYYQRDGTNSQWNLPEQAVSPGPYAIGNGASSDLEGTGVMQNWRHSLGYQEERHYSSCGQNVSDNESSGSPEMSQNVSNLEKAGILNKTKVSENGKKVRKNWAHSWTVLHGGVLTFHKDPKSTPAGGTSKTNHIVPESKVDLKGATILRATKEKSSKKNVLELKSRSGAEFLIQYDTESIINDWHKVIVDAIHQLESDQQHSEDEEEIGEKSSSLDRDERFSERRAPGNANRQSLSSSTSESDQKNVRTKLKKFLLKRPTLQSVKDRGYIRENVFGCHLHSLCQQEKSTVPSFVEKCIRLVEKRGLGIDGLYRVSGNLAVIQKLRFKADHEDLDLEESNWDTHVITGALKLFFRELQEPLFPYNLFNEFISGIKIHDYYNKLSHMKNLVMRLPQANHDTMEVLFRHLRKVIQHGDENRMTVQNVAIVFGPTLLKPEVETANITMYMVFQNQIVEFLLNEFEALFHM
ncbi:rho GTPase-activating protein 27 [Triplophysa dalaica]|uniref:rho GTPase-activating protein 27 n=1 Tax=Triplophysa dalaica TaxID=1582913 RepID=UPI0024DF6C94|nr:rho GTPase-activating protein 27 [Triplophysa dalaica]